MLETGPYKSSAPQISVKKVLAKANKIYREKRDRDIQSEQLKAVVQVLVEDFNVALESIFNRVKRLED